MRMSSPKPSNRAEQTHKTTQVALINQYSLRPCGFFQIIFSKVDPHPRLCMKVVILFLRIPGTNGANVSLYYKIK